MDERDMTEKILDAMKHRVHVKKAKALVQTPNGLESLIVLQIIDTNNHTHIFVYPRPIRGR